MARSEFRVYYFYGFKWMEANEKIIGMMRTIKGGFGAL